VYTAVITFRVNETGGGNAVVVRMGCSLWWYPIQKVHVVKEKGWRTDAARF
jgi:hypothetical protein